MKRFNLRCYAIIINDKQEILLSDERRNGYSFTKLVGGGLKWGEGTKAGLRREIREELGLNVEIGELYYFNDFFQQSAFNENEQLISFYYLVSSFEYENIVVENHPHPLNEDGEKFRWKKINALELNDVTFPVDRKVIEKIINEF